MENGMDSTSNAKADLAVQDDFANDKELSDDFVKRLRYYGEVTAESADNPTKQLMRKAAWVIETLLARSFKDVIEVQRREVMLDPSNAYMVGLHNGMAMMEANYHNRVDWECLPVVAAEDLTLEQQNYLKALNVEVEPVKQAECTNPDTSNCKYCRTTKTCEVLNSPPSNGNAVKSFNRSEPTKQ